MQYEDETLLALLILLLTNCTNNNQQSLPEQINSSKQPEKNVATTKIEKLKVANNFIQIRFNRF